MIAIMLDTALEDLLQAVAYFEGQSEGLGIRFKLCVEKAIVRILDIPRLFGVIHKGYRLCKVDRLKNHGILYRVRRHVIVIHGIIHLQRGPHFWQQRLR